MMNRYEFMEQLKKRLRKLPFDEVREAVDYYEQYFDDAGEENEQSVIDELGSPANVASQIIADFAIKGADRKESAKWGLSTVWIVILAIFASPIALPMAFVVAILVLVVLIVILAIIFSIGVTGLALFLAGILSAVLSIPVLFQSFSTALFYLGSGMACFGVGTTILIATGVLSKKCFGWLSKQVGRFILRRNEK